MYILIQKVNCGVAFTPCSKNGKARPPTTRRRLRGEPLEHGEATTAALAAAERWYRDRVCEAFEKSPVNGCGYHEGVKLHRPLSKTVEEGLLLELEPWGFAVDGEGGKPVMNDTGSTPTGARAWVLACYQAPLLKVRVDDTTARFERVVETSDCSATRFRRHEVVGVAG